MHSFLGGCALERDDLEQAVAHYRRSLELADAPIDQYFASVGLLRCYQRQSRPDPFEATVKHLLDLVEREGLVLRRRGPVAGGAGDRSGSVQERCRREALECDSRSDG